MWTVVENLEREQDGKTGTNEGLKQKRQRTGRSRTEAGKEQGSEVRISETQHSTFLLWKRIITKTNCTTCCVLAGERSISGLMVSVGCLML